MFSSNGPIRGQKVFLMTKSSRFLMYICICFISGGSTSHFLGIIMLIRLQGTLAQTNVRVDRKGILVRGPSTEESIHICHPYDKISVLTQTRMEFCRIIFSSKGAMRGKCVFLMVKRSNLYGSFIV